MKIEVFYEIVDFFVLDMCSKPIFCSNVAQKGKIFSRLLEPQKVAQKLSSTIIGKGLETMGAFHLRKKPGNFGGSKSGISDR